MALLLLAGCSAGETALPAYELSGSAMGTSWNTIIVAPPETVDRDRLRDGIAATLETLEASMSTWRPASELSRFNANPGTGWIPVSRTLCDAVAAAQSVSRMTGGAFDVTVGPLVNLWGFGPDDTGSRPPAALPLTAARARVGYSQLDTDCTVPALRKARGDVYVDLSAFAKGYAVDAVAELLEAEGVHNYLVEIGGELRLRGMNARRGDWRVAIEVPERSGRGVQKILDVTDTAVATSGDYRNFYEYDGRYYSHTIDPASGEPVTHTGASATVLAERAAIADGLATALMVMGPDAGIAFADRANIAVYILARRGAAFEALASRRFVSEVDGG